MFFFFTNKKHLSLIKEIIFLNHHYGTNICLLVGTVFQGSNVASWASCLKSFLANRSWKLKRAFLIACRLSVCPSVCKLFLFSSSSQKPLGQFQTNLAQSILGWRGFKFVQTWHKTSSCIGIQVCSNEGPCSFPRGENNETAKIHWRKIENLFSPEPLG